MVKHIVFFKLSPETPPEKRLFFIKEIEKIFSSLPRKLPYIAEYRTGINYNNSSYAWDLAIDSVFLSRDDLQRYQLSEEHQEAVRKASVIEKTKAVVDYEY